MTIKTSHWAPFATDGTGSGVGGGVGGVTQRSSVTNRWGQNQDGVMDYNTYDEATVSRSAVWLDLFNAELSPKRCWRGPRSQEVGEEWDCT